MRNKSSQWATSTTKSHPTSIQQLEDLTNIKYWDNNIYPPIRYWWTLPEVTTVSYDSLNDTNSSYIDNGIVEMWCHECLEMYWKTQIPPWQTTLQFTLDQLMIKVIEEIQLKGFKVISKQKQQYMERNDVYSVSTTKYNTYHSHALLATILLSIVIYHLCKKGLSKS